MFRCKKKYIMVDALFQHAKKHGFHLKKHIIIEELLMTTKPIRVVVADDHPMLRRGLQASLDTSPLVETVGVVGSFSDLLTCLRETPTDVIVLDLGGMGTAPITMVTRLLREYPNIGCVIFSSSAALAPEMLQLGVQGYVVKEELEEHLVSAISAAHRRGRYLSPIVKRYVERSHNLRSEHSLTPQELNVVRLMTTGLSTLATAEELAVDPRTVQNHIMSARRKTGCDERTQLIAWYLRMYGPPPAQ